MKTKHTPSPWEVKNRPGQGLQIEAKVGDGDFFHDFKLKGDITQPFWMLLSYAPWVQFPKEEWEEMQEANAKVMAAAPELLDALDAVEAFLLDVIGIDESRDVFSPRELLKLVQNAIQKATS